MGGRRPRNRFVISGSRDSTDFESGSRRINLSKKDAYEIWREIWLRRLSDVYACGIGFALFEYIRNIRKPAIAPKVKVVTASMFMLVVRFAFAFFSSQSAA